MATTETATATPWVERYRPKSLSDVAHQSEVVATLQNAVETGRLPHLLFYGPPGSGKTSVALALCRQLWAPSEWRRRVLELNASDERGISVVRDKIKHFASLAVSKPAKKVTSFFGKDRGDDSKEQSYPNPPYKVIILDEADTVTPDAQAALRRIIEASSKVTRFILICNYVTRIIEPLASRCAKFRFQALPAASMTERVQKIAVAEGCHKKAHDLIEPLLRHVRGDMRRAVTTLQSLHALGDGVTTETLHDIVGVPPEEVVAQLWSAISETQFEDVRKVVEAVCLDGYSARILLASLLPRLMEDSALGELGKAKVAIRIAEAEKNMIEGASEYLQLLTVCSLASRCYAASSQHMDEG